MENTNNHLDDEKTKALVNALADALIRAAEEGSTEYLAEMASAFHPYLFPAESSNFDINP